MKTRMAFLVVWKIVMGYVQGVMGYIWTVMGYSEHFMGYQPDKRGVWRVYGLYLEVYGLSTIYLWYKLSIHLIDYNLLMFIFFETIIKICNDNGKLS